MSYSFQHGSLLANSHVCRVKTTADKGPVLLKVLILALTAALTIWMTSVKANQPSSLPQNTLLSLAKAISLAHERDPWLAGSIQKERSMMAKSTASLALPDPVVSLSIANVPADGFSFNQEPMTQLRAGVSQMLPRGNSRHIRSQYQQALALEQPILRMERIAKSTVMVTALWLDAYSAQAKILLMGENQILLGQLGDIAKANYASAIGNTRQQDVIGADLEATKIEDLLIQLKAEKTASIQRLNEWLQLDNNAQAGIVNSLALTLPNTLPELEPLSNTMLVALNNNDRQTLANMLSNHPTIQAIDQRIRASKTAIELAKQKYHPQWGLNASYAYRDDDMLGTSRADFLSIGISFDVPLYTSQKQDNEVSASVYTAESIKTDKRLALRQLMSQLSASFTMHKQLQERRRLYNTQILPQTMEQAETVLNAFTNNDGNFNEVVQAQITQLNAHLNLLDIAVKQHKVSSQLHYYMSKTSHQEAQ
jgi:hypothetical protein